MDVLTRESTAKLGPTRLDAERERMGVGPRARLNIDGY